MLHFHTLTDAKAAGRYFSAADYHFEGAEQTAYTVGRGAKLLGLPPEATPEHFLALLNNTHPLTGERLTNAKRADRDIGRDMTVSNVKSVSIAKYLGDDPRIAQAEKESIQELVALMERDVSCRVRKRGQDFDRPTGNVVGFVFPHDTSRPIDGVPDPQSHSHVVLLNLTRDPAEGEWKAVQFKEMLRDSGYYNAAYRSILANKLRDLGYAIRPTRDAFEIEGIDDRAVAEFSRRTAQVEERAEELGVTNPDTKAKLGATTREKKTKGLTWGQLVERWRGRMTPEELKHLDDTVGLAKEGIPYALEPSPEKAARESMTHALDHVLYRKSVASEREVVRECLRHGLATGVTIDDAWRALDAPQIIRDGPKVTTRAVISEERKVMDFVAKGRGRFRPLGKRDQKVPATLTPGKEEPPTEGQANAIKHIWDSPDRAIVVYGGAGVGKTSMLKAALAGIDGPHAVLAPSAEASRGVLRRDGFSQADTLAGFLNSAEQQAKVRGGLIVLDEASLAPVRDVARLSQVADSLDARILFVGDRRQHLSPSRGDTLALLERGGARPVEVSEVKRQRGEYKDAVDLLRKGRGDLALDKFLGMGWFKEAKPGHAEVAAEYVESVKAGKETAIVCPTHAEGAEVNAAVRGRMRDEGMLAGESRTLPQLIDLQLTPAELKEAKKRNDPGVQFTRFGAYRPATIELAAGDKVRATAGGKDAGGGQIDRGQRFTVRGFTNTGDLRVMSDHGTAERVIPSAWGHLRHDYASTSFAAQGRTVDRVMVVMGDKSMGAVDAATAYVAVSRAREKATIYASNPGELRERWQRASPRPLASDMVRPRRKLLRRLKARVQQLARLPERALEMLKSPEREMNLERA